MKKTSGKFKNIFLETFFGAQALVSYLVSLLDLVIEEKHEFLIVAKEFRFFSVQKAGASRNVRSLLRP